jgi:hypothetical protein
MTSFSSTSSSSSITDSPSRARGESKVSWGIPGPLHLEENPNSDHLAASYLHSRKKNMLDGCSESSPIVLWEGPVLKQRRIRGGFVNRYFTLFAVMTQGASQGEKIISMGFTYRDNYMSAPPAVKGVIKSVEKFSSPVRGFFPVAGGGVCMETICSTKVKKYFICFKEEELAEDFVKDFHDLEEQLKEACDELAASENTQSIAEKAATAAREHQLEFLTSIEASLASLKAIYEAASLSDEEYTHIKDSLEIYKNITKHLKGFGKNGASLQTAKLESVMTDLEKITESATTNDKAYLQSDEYLADIRRTLAYGMVAATDLQFGMTCTDTHAADKARVKGISLSLLDTHKKKDSFSGIDQDLAQSLSPLSGQRLSSSMRECKYSNWDEEQCSEDRGGEDSDGSYEDDGVVESRNSGRDGGAGGVRKVTKAGGIERRQTPGFGALQKSTSGLKEQFEQE